MARHWREVSFLHQQVKDLLYLGHIKVIARGRIGLPNPLAAQRLGCFGPLYQECVLILGYSFILRENEVNKLLLLVM